MNNLSTVNLKCPKCLGKRYKEGMGYMRMECENCGGKGYLIGVEPAVTPSVHKDILTTPKRRGRPPKTKDEING